MAINLAGFVGASRCYRVELDMPTISDLAFYVEETVEIDGRLEVSAVKPLSKVWVELRPAETRILRMQDSILGTP